MQFYWILSSHIVALLPISQCLWSFKQHRTYDSLLTLLHLIFTVYFSICYHTHDYDDVKDIVRSLGMVNVRTKRLFQMEKI